MANEIKKYLDATALSTLVDQIKAEDAKVLTAAEKYTDDSLKLYETAGSAASALADAKAYTDALANGQVKTNKEDIAKLNGDASTEGSVAKAVADAKALIDADIDVVEGVANKNKDDIAAINNAESGILAQAKAYADEEDAKVEQSVANLTTYVGTIPEGATATDIVGYVQEKTNGIATEGAMTELGNRIGVVEGKVATIEGDYLKGADKTELEGEIAAVQTAVDNEKTRAEGIESGLRTDVDAIKNDYLKGEDKTELSNAIVAEKERAEGIEGGLRTDVDAIKADYLKAADKEALQTQINTIINNPDTEGVINSINEFTQYIADHGEIADGFRTDIDQNKEDIEALEGALGEYKELVGTTYATKTELANEKAALQDEIDADVAVVAGRVTTLEGVVANKVEQSVYEAKVTELEGADTGLANRIAALEAKHGDGEGTVESLIATAKQEAIDAAGVNASNQDAVVLAESQKYTDAEIDKVEGTIATLTETVGTKAAQSEVDTISGKVGTLETKVGTLETEMDAVQALADAADKAAKANADAIKLKASQADLEAAVARIATNEGAISTINTTLADKAEQDDLDALVTRVTTAEGNITANTSAINSFAPISAAEVEALFA